MRLQRRALSRVLLVLAFASAPCISQVEVAGKDAVRNWEGRLLISYGRLSPNFVEMDASGETLWTHRLGATKEWKGGINQLLEPSGAPRGLDSSPCLTKARLLPNGHRLICQIEGFHGDGANNFLVQLFEHDRAGKLVWQQQVSVPDPGTHRKALRAVQRLRSGNTLVATENLVLEIGADGTIVNKMVCPNEGFPTSFSWAQERYTGEIQLYCAGQGFNYFPMYTEIESWRPLVEEDATRIPEFSEDTNWSPFSAEHAQYSPLGSKTMVFSGESIVCLSKNEIAWTRNFDKQCFRPRHWPVPDCEGFEFLDDGSFFLAQSFLFPVYDTRGMLTRYDRRSRITLFDKKGKVVWETSFKHLANSISYLKRPTR